MAPSTMASASLSSSLFWWASRSSSSSSWRFFGSWAKAWVSLPSHDFCPLLDRSSLIALTRGPFLVLLNVDGQRFRRLHKDRGSPIRQATFVPALPFPRLLRHRYDRSRANANSHG